MPAWRKTVVAGALLVSLTGGLVGSGGVAFGGTTTTTVPSSTTTTLAATTTTVPSSTTTTVPSSTTTTVPSSTTTTVPATTTTVPKRRPTPILRLGNRGSLVLTLQRRLTALGYWLGPPNGIFGDSTRQAVYALQKAASISPDGAVGRATAAALARRTRSRPRSTSGNVIEVNLRRGLLMIVRNGRLVVILSTSTGGGYTYVSGGVTAIAKSPLGVFYIFRQVNGLDISPLGQLWRPKYFDGGFAIHGDSFVPPYPISHGCIRVSNEAINWIWANNLMPLGTKVWVYS
jgi:peptidoglycan hydrolase-like protein with peptidoglycan-binding domain